MTSTQPVTSYFIDFNLLKSTAHLACPFISKFATKYIENYSVFSRFFILPVHCSLKNVMNSVSVSKIEPNTVSKHIPPMPMWMNRFNQPLLQQNIRSETAVIMKDNINDNDTIFDGNIPRRGFRLELMKNLWMKIEL